MTILNEAQKDLDRCKAELSAAKNCLRNAPAGTLKCVKTGRQVYYYCRADNTVKYIKRREHGLARALALKEFYQIKRKRLEKNIAALEHLIKQYEDSSDATVMAAMGRHHAGPIKDLLYSDDILRKWAGAKQDTNGLFPEQLRQPTLCGIKVRSKSEAMIADELFRSKIPFRYESPLNISGQNHYPDFTILHPGTRKVLLWEHFGLMSDPQYRRKALVKIDAYAGAGYRIGDDLICTFEWDDLPLDPGEVHRIITDLLLR